MRRPRPGRDPRAAVSTTVLFLALVCAGRVQAQQADGHPTIGSIERADPRLDAIVPPGAVMEVVAEGHIWVEGPLWVPALGGVLFSDTRSNAIYLWREGTGDATWLEPSGYTGSVPRGEEMGSNGLMLDLQGRLLIAQHGDRRIARLDAPLDDPAPRFTTLADRYEGKRLNSPNDIAVRANGEIYFTDPPYGLEQGVDDPARELDFYGVYRIRTDGTLELLVDDIPRPNGIVFSPDQSLLYVSSSGGSPATISVFEVAPDGTLRNGKVFARTWGDGMTIDQSGNLYVGGPGGGVMIFAPDGTHLGTLVTTSRTSNVTFGEDGSSLFITAGERLLRLQVTAKGVGF